MHSSSPSQSSALMRPNAWLKELTRLKPAHWRWGRSIRVALGMAIPLGFGLALDNIASVLFIAMGAMLQGVGERDAPYAVLFKKAAISAPLGAVSFLLGYLSALPLGVMVGVMACVAFVSAIISSYSAALSIGCLQLLAMGGGVHRQSRVGALLADRLYVAAGFAALYGAACAGGAFLSAAPGS